MIKIIFGLYIVIGLLCGGFMAYSFIRYKKQISIVIKEFNDIRSLRSITYTLFTLFICLAVMILWPIVSIAIALLLYDDTFPEESQKPEEGNEESE